MGSQNLLLLAAAAGVDELLRCRGLVVDAGSVLVVVVVVALVIVVVVVGFPRC